MTSRTKGTKGHAPCRGFLGDERARRRSFGPCMSLPFLPFRTRHACRLPFPNALACPCRSCRSERAACRCRSPCRSRTRCMSLPFLPFRTRHHVLAVRTRCMSLPFSLPFERAACPCRSVLAVLLAVLSVLAVLSLPICSKDTNKCRNSILTADGLLYAGSEAMSSIQDRTDASKYGPVSSRLNSQSRST